MFPSLATRETLFPGAKHVSATRQKQFLLTETMFPVWPNWETLGKHVSAVNVTGNMFPRFSRALRA